MITAKYRINLKRILRVFHVHNNIILQSIFTKNICVPRKRSPAKLDPADCKHSNITRPNLPYRQRRSALFSSFTHITLFLSIIYVFILSQKHTSCACVCCFSSTIGLFSLAHSAKNTLNYVLHSIAIEP